MEWEQSRPTVARISAQQVNARRQHQQLDYVTVRNLVRAVQYSDRNRGLPVAVRVARERGMPWQDIAAVLDMDVDEAQRKFGYVDAELALDGVEIPATPQVTDPPVRPRRTAKKQEPVPADVTAEIFGRIRKLPLEELEQRARAFAEAPVAIHAPRRYRSQESVEREAVIIALYESHDFGNREIAELMNLSVQRIQQIVAAYYDRMEAVWEQERQERIGG